MNLEIIEKQLNNKEISINELSFINNETSVFKSDSGKIISYLSYVTIDNKRKSIDILYNNGKYKVTDSIDESINFNEIIEKDNILFFTKKNPKIGNALLGLKNRENNINKIKDFYLNIIENKFLFALRKEADIIIDKIKNKTINNDELYGFLNYSIEEKSFFNRENIINDINKIVEDNNILKLINNMDMESIEDIIKERKNMHQFKLIMKSELTNKNKIILNKDSIEIIKKITDIGVTAKEFHGEFIKKIAKYKDENELLNGLRLYLNKKDGWFVDNYLDKVSNMEYEYKDNILIVNIKNFEESQKIGSNNWCISTDDYYFKKYKSETNRLFFIYDFNKDINDRKRLIGLTVNYLGNIVYAYDELDNNISNHDLSMFKFNKLSEEDFLSFLTDDSLLLKYDMHFKYKDKFINYLIQKDEKHITNVIVDLIFKNKNETKNDLNFILKKVADKIDLEHEDLFYIYEQNKEIQKIFKKKYKELSSEKKVKIVISLLSNYFDENLKNELIDFLVNDNEKIVKFSLSRISSNLSKEIIEFNLNNEKLKPLQTKLFYKNLFNSFNLDYNYKKEIYSKINENIKNELFNDFIFNQDNILLYDIFEQSRFDKIENIFKETKDEIAVDNIIKLIESSDYCKNKKIINDAIIYIKKNQDKQLLILNTNNIKFCEYLDILLEKNIINKTKYKNSLAFNILMNKRNISYTKKSIKMLKEIREEKKYNVLIDKNKINEIIYKIRKKNNEYI